MKIAYVMYPGACFVGHGDGTKMQALLWAQALKERNHQVDFIEPWGNYNWKEYDVVHVFGIGLWNYDFIRWGSKLNPNFIFSPIIDSNTPMPLYKLATFVGIEKLRMFSQNKILRLLKKDVKIFLARSAYEAEYLSKGYGISSSKISIVPLSYRNDDFKATEREPFCLFAGTTTQPRKNVPALIAAAKKYGFKLVLVGNNGNEASQAKLKELVGGADNIEVKGFVSDDELIAYYNRAKVFALPSLNEGVGLVALEAAVNGCEIVITNLGGPKEYYGGYAHVVNPHSVDEIGQAILTAMNGPAKQPQLRNHILQNYNTELTTNLLLESYNSFK